MYSLEVISTSWQTMKSVAEKRKYHRDYMREYQRNNPVQNAKMKMRQKAWYLKNKELIISRSAQYQKDNKEKTNVKNSAYKKTDKGKIVNKRAKYIRRQQEKIGYFTKEQLEGRISVYGGLCYLCGKIANTIDHVIPLARGGSNFPANLRPACFDCNLKKGKKLLIELLTD